MIHTDESLVFSKIVRYVAQQARDTLADRDDEEVGHITAVLVEIADAFEYTGGFKYDEAQAAHLGATFDMLAVAMMGLSEQAGRMEQHNAAAKMQWAATQASEMAQEVRQRHEAGSGGVIAFVDDFEEGQE